MSRDRTVIRLGLKRGSFRSSGLSHIEAGDGAADDHALDLGGALEDREVVRGIGLRPGCMFVIITLNCCEIDHW